VSSLFADFCSTWRILHITSSAGHQNENGKAEAAVKSATYMLKRTALQHQDEYLALLELHNTPRQDVRESPAEIMFGRVTPSLLPTLLKPCHHIDLNTRCKRQIAIKKYYDKRARSLQPLCVSDRIMFQSSNKEGWQKGQIVRKLGARPSSDRHWVSCTSVTVFISILIVLQHAMLCLIQPIPQHVMLCLAHPQTLVSLQVRVRRLLSMTQLPMCALRNSTDHQNDYEITCATKLGAKSTTS